MCEHCHYLTDILIHIIHDDTCLTNDLCRAIAAGDIEQTAILRKSIEETEIQIRINFDRMREHVRSDHRNELKTTPVSRAFAQRAGA